MILFATWISGGCVFLVRQVGTYEVPLTGSSLHREPLKVQMLDGSAVLFRSGATVSTDGVNGVNGTRRFLNGEERPAGFLPADSITGVLAYRTEISTGKSVAASALATGVIVGGIAIAAAADDPPPPTDTAGCAPPPTYSYQSVGR